MTHNSLILRTHEDVRIVRAHSFSNYGTDMSLGIGIKGPEGIVLAADSRVTLGIQQQVPDGPLVEREFHFDNSHKLLHFADKDKREIHGYFGAVTYGVAVIPGTVRTAHSYFHEFEKTLANEKRKTVEEYAVLLGEFYTKLWKKNIPSDYAGVDMIFIVGGYDKDEPYGKIFVVNVPVQAKPAERNPTDFGMTWGGQLSVASRIVHGIDPQMLEFLGHKFGLDDAAQVALKIELQAQFQYRIPYEVLPLQDCVDLAILLIRTTAGIQARAAVPRGVGGMVEVAIVTQTEPLDFVQRKTLRGDFYRTG